jgi:hypothetical protein
MAPIESAPVSIENRAISGVGIGRHDTMARVA